MKLANNRRAGYEFTFIQKFEAGIVLKGSEVKSIRAGEVNISDSFIYLKGGEVWIKNMKVARYKQMHSFEVHDDNRDKKLLLNRSEILKIEKLVLDKGTTIIPISIYLNNNKIKVEISVAKGKKLWDKRNSIKERDVERDLRRNG